MNRHNGYVLRGRQRRRLHPRAQGQAGLRGRVLAGPAGREAQHNLPNSDILYLQYNSLQHFPMHIFYTYYNDYFTILYTFYNTHNYTNFYDDTFIRLHLRVESAGRDRFKKDIMSVELML